MELSRRRLLRDTAVAVWTGVAAACAPTRTLTHPPAVGRAQVTPLVVPTGEASEDGARSADAVRSATTTPVPVSIQSPVPARAVPAPSPSATLSASAPAAGDRPYLLRPAIRGTVQFVHGWEGPFRPRVEVSMTAFTAAYPEIEIEAEQVEPRQLHDTLVTSLASGTPPNAIMLRSDSMPYFADARALASLDALFERDGVRRGWFRPRELAARTWDSQLYGLPHVSVGAEQMLYVNLGLLERLGRDPAQPISTWAQIMALVEPARRIGAVALDPTRCASGVLALQVWGYAAGGRWLDDGGRQVTWAEPPVVEAAEWMQQIVAAQRGEATLPPVGEPGASALTVQEWALQKHVCCVNDAAWQARLAQEAPHLRFAVYEVPAPDRVPSGQHRSPSFGGWLLAIPRAGRDQEAAWEWLKHLALGNTADELAQLQGRPPPLAATPGAVPDSRPSPVAPVVLAAQVHSVVVPAPPTKARLDDIAREAQVALFSQRPSPGPILQAAARDGQQLLDEWHGTRRRA